MKTSTIVSAGGVLHDDKGRIVLTARRSFKGEIQWGLPKGIIELGEDEATAARREATEETGYAVEIEDRLPSIEYWYVQPAQNDEPPARVHKFVHFFLMRITGGDPAEHDAETEEVAMLEPWEALRRAAFDTEKSLIEKAAGLIKQ